VGISKKTNLNRILSSFNKKFVFVVVGDEKFPVSFDAVASYPVRINTKVIKTKPENV
jgi:hypothetical protein